MIGECGQRLRREACDAEGRPAPPGSQLGTRQPTWRRTIAVVKEEDCYWYKFSGLRRATLAVRCAKDRVRGSGGGVIADERGFFYARVSTAGQKKDQTIASQASAPCARRTQPA
jgi:hypothetical protein